MGNQISLFRQSMDWIYSFLPGREPEADDDDDEPPAKVRAVDEDDGEGLEALAEAAEQAQAVPANTFVIDGELVPRASLKELRVVGKGDTCVVRAMRLPASLKETADCFDGAQVSEVAAESTGEVYALKVTFAATPPPHPAAAAA